ncbi:MAG TPA: hypothetical protein VMV07_22700, partial [Streptosporangiaceae bacterium]|nr:hypothetical protein [Streptosporangiaceae bacterium]
MIDTRAVGQELQEQLVVAARKGQEQIRKGQEQAREQVRKGQEVFTEVVRALAATAEAFRPQLPAIKLPSLPPPTLPRWPGSARLPSAGTVMITAQEIAEQVLAAQRKFAEQVAQVAQVAGPLLAQGAAHLGRAAQTAGLTTP